MANQLATPDPLSTSEVLIGGLATALITNVIILFKLNINDAQQAGLITLINTLISIGILVHGALVRKGRAQSTHPLDSFNPQPEYPPEDLKVVPE